MSDLETRLADALRGAGARAPHPGDLVAPARARLHRRRRTTAAAVAAAVAVVAIPVGVLAQHQTEPDVTTVVPEVPDSWRTESYRSLSLRVPSDWGYQGGPDWCLGDGRPAVTKSEGWFAGAGCEPRFGYGVQFRDVPAEIFPEPSDVPDDAFLALVGDAGTSAWIVAESEEQLALIVESVDPIVDVDANGCPQVVDAGIEGSGDRVSVCRYDSGALEQSELLSVEDSRALAREVARAPSTSTLDVDLACPPYSVQQPVITLRSADVSADILPSTSCLFAGVLMDGPTERLLTEGVLYWALSPGWQGSDSDLPLPDPLRAG